MTQMKHRKMKTRKLRHKTLIKKKNGGVTEQKYAN